MMQTIILNEKRNVTLTVMLQKNGEEFSGISKHPAVLVLPGGGYNMCSDREAETVAFPYLQAGYQAFVLRYSVAEHKTWPNPLEDYEQAMELIQEKAEEWKVLTDKIAVIGFSAGGHLAACAATISRNRPVAAIIGYGAVGRAFTDFMHPDVPAPSPTDFVDEKTCPCFLFAARDDKLVLISNTREFEAALDDKGIMYESHIYAFGDHGFSTGEKFINKAKLCNRVRGWVKDSIEWLEEVMGILTSDGMTEPICPSRMNKNGEPFLSVDCTINYLKERSEVTGPLLAELFKRIEELYPMKEGVSSNIYDLIGPMNLRTVLEISGQQEIIQKIEDALCQIPSEKK